MRKISILILFCLNTIICSAQKKIFEKTVDDNLFTTEKGPNKKTFSHIYFQYSMFPVDYEGAEINMLKSASYGMGYRYKYKLTHIYSLGVDANLLFYNFNLKQDSQKQLPNTVQHKKEILETTNFSLELYQRIIIGRAGNMLGLYFDVGGYVSSVLAPTHIYKDEIFDSEYNSEKRIIRQKGLTYFEPFVYGVRTRLGYNKLGVVAEYRLSNLLKEKFEYPKLPDWSVGIQLSVF